jgi:hypothetical protein
MKARRDFVLAAMVGAAMAILVLAVGCSAATGAVEQNRSATARMQATPPDAWLAAVQKSPFPYLFPLPEPNRSAVDGTYAKVEVSEAPHVHCLRCPDYAPEGGAWKLNLDRGVFHIFHEPSGWQSGGSYVVTRDRWTSGAPDQLLLFNDPTCPDAIGLYTWRLEEGNLRLEVVDDTCAIYLRAANLTGLPWLSCQPPNVEAGITDHWPKPPGCE